MIRVGREACGTWLRLGAHVNPVVYHRILNLWLMSATLVQVLIKRWAVRTEGLSYQSCGFDELCDLVGIGCRGESQNRTTGIRASG